MGDRLQGCAFLTRLQVLSALVKKTCNVAMIRCACTCFGVAKLMKWEAKSRTKKLYKQLLKGSQIVFLRQEIKWPKREFRQCLARVNTHICYFPWLPLDDRYLLQKRIRTHFSGSACLKNRLVCPGNCRWHLNLQEGVIRRSEKFCMVEYTSIMKQCKTMWSRKIFNISLIFLMGIVCFSPILYHWCEKHI